MSANTRTPAGSVVMVCSRTSSVPCVTDSWGEPSTFTSTIFLRVSLYHLSNKLYATLFLLIENFLVHLAICLDFTDAKLLPMRAEPNLVELAAKVYQNVHIIFELNKTSTNGHWPKGKVNLDAYDLFNKNRG